MKRASALQWPKSEIPSWYSEWMVVDSIGLSKTLIVDGLRKWMVLNKKVDRLSKIRTVQMMVQMVQMVQTVQMMVYFCLIVYSWDCQFSRLCAVRFRPDSFDNLLWPLSWLQEKTPKSSWNGSKFLKFFILLFSNLIFRNQKPFLIKIVNVLDSVLLLWF